MGILQNPLGISLTDFMPIINSPFNNSEAEGNQSFPPAPSEFMITEGGLFMLTEDGLNLMITE